MSSRPVVIASGFLAATTFLVGAGTASAAGAENGVTGSFTMNGSEAQLTHVRAARTPLDERSSGFVVLLTSEPPEGEIHDWRSAEPVQVGSFVFLLLEEQGGIWSAEIGHVAATDGRRFGVIMELEPVAFTVTGDRIEGHYRTRGEEDFLGDRYTLDLTFAATLEP